MGFDKKADIVNIVNSFGIELGEIIEITALKKGMTNRSYLMVCEGAKYIVRTPGLGTEKLIDRKGEAAVYRAIAGKGIGDDLVYIDSVKGYKVARFLEGVHCCDAYDKQDVKKCMEKLRIFHEMELSVSHEFDIFKQIEFYESLRGETPSLYDDYQRTKEQVFSLKPYIEAHVEKKVLTHIDAVPDNFLLPDAGTESDEIRLIDWEYAGMQDPHLDLAMFCIYSLYDKKQVDWLIQTYFSNRCQKAMRIKIYCYIAAGGLLWSNWCEYKHSMGVLFGGYAKRQYQYAAEYYKIVQNELGKL